MAKKPKTTKPVDADHDGHSDDTGQFVSPNPGRAGKSGLPLHESGVTEAEIADVADQLSSISKLAEGVVDPGPSIGRIVHYYTNSADGPYAAIITSVGAGSVGLTVFVPRLRGTVCAADVPYVDDAAQEGPCWRWPPGSGGPPPSLANFHHLPGPKLFGETK